MSKNTKPSAPTNFDVWRDALTPESIADSKFITLSCSGCPASGEACSKYDAACRSNFLDWAKSKAKPEPQGIGEEATECTI